MRWPWTRAIDPHYGYSCEEMEERDDMLTDLFDSISASLSRGGFTVDLDQHPLDHWVGEALHKLQVDKDQWHDSAVIAEADVLRLNRTIVEMRDGVDGG